MLVIMTQFVRPIAFGDEVTITTTSSTSTETLLCIIMYAIEEEIASS